MKIEIRMQPESLYLYIYKVSSARSEEECVPNGGAQIMKKFFRKFL